MVLDLGDQATGSTLPYIDDPTPDEVGPLRMVCCDGCGLLQLEEGIVASEELMATEPSAMLEQGRQAVSALMATGLARRGQTFRTFASPHGNGWERQLLDVGLLPAKGPADVVLDIFGLMHETDQAAALTDRIRCLVPGGRLVLQVHPFGVDVAKGSWNALRHGHYAYYSLEWLVSAVASRGMGIAAAWIDPLQGGTAVLVISEATRPTDPGSGVVSDFLAWESQCAPVTRSTLDTLASRVKSSAEALRGYISSCVNAGLTVAGYAAGSGVPALLALSQATSTDVVAIADASPDKQGRALPVSRIPVVSPASLETLQPDRIIVFVSGLLDDARNALPASEQRGARFVTLDPEPVEAA